MEIQNKPKIARKYRFRFESKPILLAFKAESGLQLPGIQRCFILT
jgi:hypothetical protein